MRIIFFIIIFLLTSGTAYTASIELSSSSVVGVDTQFPLDVRIMTDGNSINSVDVTVDYPEELLTFSGYQDTSGTITFWVQQPHVVNGKVRFVGGIPGGVDQTYGADNQSVSLVRLLFTPINSGTATFTIDESTILLNDGKGTALKHSRTSSTVSISNESLASNVDTTAPESFAITLIPADPETKTPQMIAFRAIDRESGIRGYQGKAGWWRWKEIQNPHQVRRGILPYLMKVRAIDAFGNATISTITIPGIIPRSVGIIILVLIIASVWRYFMIKKKV